MAKQRKSKLKMKKKFKTLFLLLFVVIIVFICTNKLDIKSFKIASKPFKYVYNKLNQTITNGKLEDEYNKCILNPINDENFNETTLNKKNEIINYAKSNNLKYTYEDIDYAYQINYAENDSLYGASLIKLVAALYLIDKDVDLNQTIKYESKYKQAYSEGMEKHKYGEKIMISELMKYAITYSDNTAYLMLYTFIGRNNLKEYAQSLGAKSIFTGSGDNFGNQTTYDTNIYLKKAYELINTKENGILLKEAMLNERKNKLSIPDKVVIAHKYGSYNEYYHNIGINFEDKYLISVLTTKGENASGKYINKLSELTYEFDKLYKDNVKSYCYELVYNKKD